MAHAIQRRRGTTAEHSTFTGLAGELTVDTDKNVVVVHDGKTPGGHPNAPANHNHDGAYAPVSHPHPELAATPADVQGGTGDGFVKAKDLKDASVNHAVTAGSATSAQEATTAQSAGNADTVDSYHASTTPMAQAIPVAGPSGKLDAGWIPKDPTAASSFPSGTRMLFHQSTAPTGWTKDVTINDKALRVVSGDVGSGGSVAFSTVFGRTAVDTTTLVTSQMPGHGGHGLGAGNPNGAQSQYLERVTDYNGYYIKVQGRDFSTQGGNGPHTHGLDLRLAYVDIIIATKD